MSTANIPMIDYRLEDTDLLRELCRLDDDAQMEIEVEPQEETCAKESIPRSVEEVDPTLKDQDTTSITGSTEEVDRRTFSMLDLLELSEDEQKLADEYDAHYLSNRDESDKSDELIEEKNPMASFLSPCESAELCPEEEITSDEDEDDESMPTTPTITTAFAEPNNSLVAKPDYTFDSFHPLMIGVIRTEYEEVPLQDREWEMMMEMKKVGERVWSWEPSPLRVCWSVVRY